MEELKRINAKIARQQIGKIVIGVTSVIFGTVLMEGLRIKWELPIVKRQ